MPARQDSGPRHPIAYSVIVVDMVGFSQRIGRDQAEARTELFTILENAANEAHADWDTWRLEDTGDGMMMFVPAAVPKARLVADFVRELAIALGDRNRTRLLAAHIRLRVAMHHGQVVVHGNGFAGPAPVVAARLVDSPQIRAAIANEPDASLAVLLSDQLYQDTVAQHERGLNPRDYIRVEIRPGQIKKGDPGKVAWMTVPGYAPPDLADLDGQAEEPAGGRQPAGLTSQELSGRAKGVQATHGSQASFYGDAGSTYTNTGREHGRQRPPGTR